jgi:transposase
VIGMSRYELTDFEWRALEPLLLNKPRGVPRVDDRRVLNGIFGYCAQAHRGVRGRVLRATNSETSSNTSLTS